MKATKALNNTAVASAKPQTKPYKLSDLDRLYVLVSTAGSKTWKWNYRLDNKDCTYTLGKFPQVDVAKARDLRSTAAKLVEQGIHPGEQKKAEKAKVMAEQATTFWGVASEWIDANKLRWSPYYAGQVETFLGRYVRDRPIGKRPIKQITTAQVYELIRGIASRSGAEGEERKASGSPTIALLVRQWVSAVFRLAVVSGRAERNPVADLKASDVVVRPPVKNNRALNPNELKDLLLKLKSYAGERSTVIAVELLALTFVRTVELRAAQWPEFDLDKRLWVIPAARMKIKNAGDHVVPLSAQAVALLKELREINPPAKTGVQWLWPNRRRGSESCMSATTINRVLERLGFNGADSIGFSAHGFRGTASTALHEQGARPEVIEVQLAHREKNAVKAAYNKAQYLAERIAMMQRWSDYIEGLKTTAAA
jgi:integrase